MGFLTPLWLWLGAAISIPLILHLLQRHQGPRVIFPAVRYLWRAEREHARRIRLRQLLLLLLRLAVVLLIAFAAARPFLRGAGAGHAPTAVVLIIDNSLSSGLVSGDRRVLDEFKDRALETLNRAGPDDRFWLLRAGAPWEPALPGDATTIAERVRETQATAAAADIPGSVTRARSILAQGADGRAAEIQLLSDLQVSNVRGSPALRADQAVRVLLWSPRRAEQANASVGRITIGGGLAPRAGERSSVVTAIAGTGRDSVNVRLSIDGRITGAAIAVPGASALIPLPARPASLIAGEVQIDADALRADDRRFFVATIAPPPRVVLTRATPFVAEALAVLADARRIERTASNGDVMIAPAGLGTEAAGASGGVVVIAPESPLELPAANRRLAALGINWRFEPAPATGELRFANAGAGDELARALAAVRVRQLYRLAPAGVSAADSVMLRLENGMPWAVRGARARGGRFVVLASPLTIEATTLPASTAMIPLLDRLTGAWSSVEAPRAELAPGEQITLPRGADMVIDPADVRHDVDGVELFDAAITPGVYRVLSSGRIIGAFVVNPAETESELRYADPRRVERTLSALNVKRVDSATAWQRNIYSSRVGREVWRALLALLLALLAVEALAAATGVRRAPTPPAAAEV
jgi:hypothetical protein